MKRSAIVVLLLACFVAFSQTRTLTYNATTGYITSTNGKFIITNDIDFLGTVSLANTNLVINADQFGSANPLTIKDGVQLTNVNIYGDTQVPSGSLLITNNSDLTFKIHAPNAQTAAIDFGAGEISESYAPIWALRKDATNAFVLYDGGGQADVFRVTTQGTFNHQTQVDFYSTNSIGCSDGLFVITGSTDSMIITNNNSETGQLAISSIGEVSIASLSQTKIYGTAEVDILNVVDHINMGGVWFSDGSGNVHIGSENAWDMDWTNIIDGGSIFYISGLDQTVRVSGTNEINTAYITNMWAHIPLCSATDPEVTKQPIGTFGSLKLYTSNNLAIGPSAYTNVTGWNDVKTNQFILSSDNTCVTNIYEGYYDITISISMVPHNNSAWIEGCVLTNGVDSELIGFKKQYDSAPRTDCLSDSGVMYLPAGTCIAFGLKNFTGAGEARISKASLKITTP